MKDLDKAYDEWEKEYGKECQKRLKDDPKFPLVVTPEQAILILEPDDAPENFYCDGEISHYEAMENWLGKLKRAGLNPYHRTIVKEYVFGR